MSLEKKMALKMLSREYDRAYKEANQVLARYNPCNMVKRPDGKLVCRGGTPCCPETCRHLGPNGCTTNALSCKLFLCGAAAIAEPACDRRLGNIIKRMQAIGFNWGRSIYKSKRVYFGKAKYLDRHYTGPVVPVGQRRIVQK